MPTKANRRGFLRTSGIAVGLPALQSIVPRSCRAQANDDPPRRMVAFSAPLGIHTPFLFPKAAGKNYEVTPYLQPFQPLRESYTVISGLMHHLVDGGHHAEKSFLTAAPHPKMPGFRNTVSLDVFAAEQIGHLTRFPFLSLAGAREGMSYSRSGVLIPAENSPSRIFSQLFLEGDAKQKQDRMRQLQDGQSILDLVADQARVIQRQAGYDDQQALEQYFTSVRELEQRLVQSQEWAAKPKPKIAQDPPQDINDRANISGRMQLLLDLIVLALQTDSTRLISLKGPGGTEVPNLEGVDESWHGLSHHGRSEEKIAKLAIIEKEEMRLFADFLGKLAAVQEKGSTLLDQTAVLFGSNLGNASSHSTINLPILVAGGRFRHGQHLAFDPEKSPPLANLFVNLLQHLGLEVDTFATSSGTLTGLERA